MDIVATNEAASKILIPDEADFATTSLFALHEERMSLSSPSVSAPPPHDDEDGDNEVEEDPAVKEEHIAKRKELTEREDALRSEYNTRAIATARYLQSFPCIRNAELEHGFDA